MMTAQVTERPTSGPNWCCLKCTCTPLPRSGWHACNTRTGEYTCQASLVLRQRLCLQGTYLFALLCSSLLAAGAAYEQRALFEGASLGGRRSLQQNTGLICSAEKDCLDKACTAAYAFNASSFPYNLTYTTSGDDSATTFTFSVRCLRACLQAAATLPAAAFALLPFIRRCKYFDPHRIGGRRG